MRKQFTFIISILISLNLVAQNVGIGTTSPNANAALDIKDNSRGLLIPRMDSVARKNIPNTKGLMVYDSTFNSFWYNTGVGWQRIAAGGANTAAVPGGTNVGDMLYWNGTAWILVPAGLPGQALVMSTAAVPRWGAPVTDTAAATGNSYFFPSGNNSAYKSFLGLVYARLATVELPNGGGRFLPNEPDIDFIRSLWMMQELPTDEAVLAWNDPGVQPLNQNIFEADNPIIRCMYYRLKDIVVNANSFLVATTTARLDEIKVPADEKARITIYRAEVRLLRALAYYYAIDLFGGFEMLTENDPATGFKAPYANRSTLFNYVEGELLAIDASLPATKTNEYARVDKSTAWMLLAKLYLNAQVYTGNPKYTECITNLNKIINTTQFSLTADYKWLFLSDNNSNGAAAEILFPIVADGTKLTSYGNTTFITSASVGGSMMPADFGIAGGWFGLRTRKETAIIMDATGVNDKRNSLYKSGQNLNVNNLTNFNDGYGLTKFKNKNANGSAAASNTFVSTDFPLFRHGDVFLMYAECVLRGGTGGTMNQSVNYMNFLRNRSSAPLIILSDLTLNFIIDERVRELYWEGHRRTDLIRFGRFAGSSYLWQWKGGVANGASTAPSVNLYPIPAVAIAANDNLVQNGGRAQAPAATVK